MRWPGLSVRRLRLGLLSVLLLLAVPGALLVWQAHQQMSWESFHFHRGLARAQSERLDAWLQRWIAQEEARSFADYDFFGLAAGSADADSRSVLAQWPPVQPRPGLLGYFQVDAEGRFSTPLLPSATESDPSVLSMEQRREREALQRSVYEVLSRNRLIPRGADEGQEVRQGLGETAASAQREDRADKDRLSQQGFDELNASGQRSQLNALGRVEELQLQQRIEPSAKAEPGLLDRLSSSDDALYDARSRRKERAAGYESKRAVENEALEEARLQLFESEVDPFQFALLDSGHGVLFRSVWREGRRSVQGMLFDAQALFRGALEGAFEPGPLQSLATVMLAYQGDIVFARRLVDPAETPGSVTQLQGELLEQLRLAAPFDRLQLLWSVEQLPPGPGERVVRLSGAALFILLLLSFALLYRLGLRQLQLLQQQRGFVAAVSHELRTPLTSIRMYAEMLGHGWADEARKQEYYRFILDESERLSRLIGNVLQLARLERGQAELQLQWMPLRGLIDMARSRLQAQVQQAGFRIDWQIDDTVAKRQVKVDPDAVLQILINLVDNAVKFAAHAERRELQLSLHADGNRAARLSLRDFGPGVPAAQLNRMFELFHRLGNELTRKASGTGIGLALVRQLARAMGGEIRAVNRQPGLELQLRLPLEEATDK